MWFGVPQGDDSPFMKAFYDKGRVSGILNAVPIYAVLGEDMGLRGAHFVAYRVGTHTLSYAVVVYTFDIRMNSIPHVHSPRWMLHSKVLAVHLIADSVQSTFTSTCHVCTSFAFACNNWS